MGPPISLLSKRCAAAAQQASQAAALQAAAADAAQSSLQSADGQTSDWQSADWQSSAWASANGQTSDWGYACSVPVSLGSEALAFVDRPGDAFAARLARAETFADAHGLNLGGGCASSKCAAALLVEAADRTVCAALLCAGVAFVSVGFTCLAASVLLHNGARGAAFPFDWNVLLLDAVNAAVSCALRADDAGTRAEEWFAQLRIDRTDDWAASDGGVERNRRLTGHFLDAADAGDRARVVAKYARRYRRLARLLRRGGGPRVYLVLHPGDEEGEEVLTAWQRRVFANVGIDDDALFDAVFGKRARDVAALRSLVADRPHVSVVDLSEALQIIKRVPDDQGP
ncbi:hypothetical protein M885DRAFT_578112 [Pelagophyceae sp. CCMP2097]|nr:hypothetical protein M885DRAFT_578112 [Pelagophyceae sp. CCMP2097]